MNLKRCSSCAWAEVLINSGHRVCTEPTVNVPTAAYLAGNHEVARSCLLERGVRNGACGPAGKQWKPLIEIEILSRAE